MEMTLKELLFEFEEFYKQKSPLRYEKMQNGYDFPDIQEIKKNLHVDFLPQEYIELYSWRNGMENPKDGWENEFEEDSWFEVLPLDNSHRFLSVENAISLIEMWEEILAEKTERMQSCYWKKGFIPILEDQNCGLTVMDTIGYFGGKKGQLIYFDYTCGDGYGVVYENITKWVQTCVELLRNDIVFYKATTHKEFIIRDKVYKRINNRYTKNFKLNS